jgi:hypothetical protein
MSLRDILELVPPPSSCVYPCLRSTWIRIQSNLGSLLPLELLEYAQIFGSGSFVAGHSIEIFNPGDPLYVATVKEECEIYRGLRDDSPEFCPYNIFPEKDGILPLAGSDTGVQFYLLNGQTDHETIVFNDRSSGYLEYAMPVMDFFSEFLSNHIEYDPYFQGKIQFRPLALTAK